MTLLHAASAIFTLSMLCLPTVETLLRYSIPEEQTINSFVADIANDAGNQADHNITAGAESKFATLPGPHDQFFKFRENSGILLIKKPIDRDILCSETPDCVMLLEVAIIHPVESFRVFAVEITIEDINDHSPTFDLERWIISIPENAFSTDALYPIPAARDMDTGKNALVQYIISSASDHPFSIQTTADSGDAHAPYLNVIGHLDRENIAVYNFVITAVDNGSPHRSSSLPVTIVVTDVNDNSPVFEFPEYNITIIENLEAPTVIARVSAADEDEGANGVVSYSLISPTRELYGNLFEVDNTTGDVSLIRSLDHNYRDIYILLISASDRGLRPRTATVRMLVKVEDVNSHEPVLTVNSLTESGRPEVLENSPIGAFVAYASVQDLDRGQNGDVSCGSMNSDFVLHEMHSRTYKITTARSFDREVDHLKKIQVECRDRGVPPLKSYQETEVVILDEDDNVPEFDRAVYRVSVVENTVVGRSIVSVSASDKDLGVNAEVVYRLNSKDGAQHVRFLPGTNVIVTRQALDFEKTPEVQFEVIAFNRAKPSRFSTASVLVTVLNENDCTPLFTQESYSFAVFENVPAPADVGAVSAIDCDAPPFNEFYYQMAHDSKASDLFTVDPYSGKMSVKAALDRESSTSHQFSVWVTDAHNLTKTSSADVVVYVADKNDNEPRITYPADGTVFLVSPRAPVGHVVTTVEASDADTDENSQLRHNLSKDSGRFFDIDAQTGAISVAESLLDLENRILQLRVTVSDQGSPTLTSSAIFAIQVNASAGDEGFFLLPRASTAKSLLSLPYHQILVVLAAVTALLVVVLVVAIAWMRRRNGEANTYLHPSKLATDFVCESKPESAFDESININRIYDSKTEKSPDSYNRFIVTDSIECIRPAMTQSPQARAWNERFNSIESTKADGTHFQSTSSPSKPNSGKANITKDISPRSSRFRKLTYFDDCNRSPTSSSSSIFDTIEDVNATQNSKVLTTFLPVPSSPDELLESYQPEALEDEDSSVYNRQHKFVDGCCGDGQLLAVPSGRTPCDCCENPIQREACSVKSLNAISEISDICPNCRGHHLCTALMAATDEDAMSEGGPVATTNEASTLRLVSSTPPRFGQISRDLQDAVQHSFSKCNSTNSTADENTNMKIQTLKDEKIVQFNLFPRRQQKLMVPVTAIGKV